MTIDTAGRRLTGGSERLDFEHSRGSVNRTVRRGRPTLYTSYSADQALLNTPTKRGWTVALLVIAVLFFLLGNVRAA